MKTIRFTKRRSWRVLRLYSISFFFVFIFCACGTMSTNPASEILGNEEYPAIAYGGYRNVDRSQAPSIENIKEDLKILDAMGIRILRTYHARLYDHTPRLLQAIEETKKADPDFEMYVMLGVWMQCQNAWTDQPIHDLPDAEENEAEIQKAIELANQYPDIVKVIAVGNESMVHWAFSYYVHPRIILKEVIRLQELKKKGGLPSDLWITTSDNFASWGGGDDSYHLPALDSLIRSVDYLSVHSYPFHDTHYNPAWWWMPKNEEPWTKDEQIKSAVHRGVSRVRSQIASVESYMRSLGVEKPIHIGETGWASNDNHLYGNEGSGAADEYKEHLYHREIRIYAGSMKMSCFYFEAFDEPWKDGKNPGGSENHFGLITTDGEVKMPLWDKIDEGTFEGLSRAGKPLRKSLEGNADVAYNKSSIPPKRSAQPAIRKEPSGSLVSWSRSTEEESTIVELYSLNPWEGSCTMDKSKEGALVVTGGYGDWFGGSLSLMNTIDLNEFKHGHFELEVRGEPNATFEVGLQSGNFEAGTQKSAFITLGADGKYELLSDSYKRIRIPLRELQGEVDLEDISATLYIRGVRNFNGAQLLILDARFVK